MNKISLLLFSVSYLLITNSIKVQTQLLDAITSQSSEKRIMENISYFTDVYGPCLLGTPNYNKSVLYAQDVLNENSISTLLESLDKGYRGWDFSSFNVQMTVPSYSEIIAYPLALTKSTNGEQEGELVCIDRMQEAYNLKGQLKGNTTF